IFHHIISSVYLLIFFFFTNPATPVFYTLSLHDALPISMAMCRALLEEVLKRLYHMNDEQLGAVIATAESRYGHLRKWRLGSLKEDRKSTRLNSSHVSISYAVFCLKKKKKNKKILKSNN